MSTKNSNLSDFDSSSVPRGSSLTIGIVVSEWNKKITESLFNGAFTTLTDFGVKSDNIKRIDVPGSFELVFGSKKMIQSNVDVVIAIGCVIKGETFLDKKAIFLAPLPPNSKKCIKYGLNKLFHDKICSKFD